MTAEAKSVYETLLQEGPLDTIALRKAAHLSSRESNSSFNKALNDLQMDFKVLPVGVSPVGAWRYAFIYELSHRHFPNLIEQASHIFEADARLYLAQKTIRSLGATPASFISRCFAGIKTSWRNVPGGCLHRKHTCVRHSIARNKTGWAWLNLLIPSQSEKE